MTLNAAESDARAGEAPSNSIETRRVVSIDALRGFDMFWIIGGGDLALAAAHAIWKTPPSWIEYQLEHVPWEGFVAWDLIMPLFLFVVGAAMPFSFSRRLEEGHSKADLYWKIARRTIILFILGMMVQGNLLKFDFLSEDRHNALHIYCNTLQAIAAGYLVAGVVILNFGILTQIAITALLLVGFWALLTFVPIAGYPAGTIEPHANFALAVDQFVLGRFIDGTDPPYTWVLSSMTFAATTMLGVFAGEILRAVTPPWQKLLSLIAVGVACLAGGYAWSEWGGFPIIKHIWTSSMVLWAAGWSFLLLATFYLIIDLIGWRRWAFPLVVIGMNAITIYVANAFIPFKRISESLVGGAARHFGGAESVIIQFVALLLAWLLLYHLYRQKIFLRI